MTDEDYDPIEAAFDMQYEAGYENGFEAGHDAGVGALFDEIERYGVTFERLHKALEQSDNWGGMVHSFEYLTVLGVIEDAWKKYA